MIEYSVKIWSVSEMTDPNRPILFHTNHLSDRWCGRF
jgi:hypothetical protein